MSGLDEQKPFLEKLNDRVLQELADRKREKKSMSDYLDEQAKIYEVLLGKRMSQTMLSFARLTEKRDINLIPPRNTGLGWIKEQAIKKFKKAGLRVKVIRT